MTDPDSSLDHFLDFAIRAAEENIAQFDDKQFWRGYKLAMTQVAERVRELRGEG